MRITGPNQLRDAYRKVMEGVSRAAERSGRRPQDVCVVAVTKTASPDQIRSIVEMGHADLGENRVQHLAQRVAALEEFLSRRRALGAVSSRTAATEVPATVRWHMIGHLQRNKVKQVIPVVQLIHSLDSLRLAEELHAFGSRTDRSIDVLMEVNVSGEASKFGIAPPAVIHLAEQIDTMMSLRLRGLMAMAPYNEDPEASRAVFARAFELFQEVRSAGVAGNNFNLLSMGMSNDFEIAIEEGANVVRVGRAIFGDQEQPDPPATP